MELHRLMAMFTGMRKELGEPEPRLRRPVRPQVLKAAMDAALGGERAVERMWRAALSTAYCALLRGGELGTQPGEAFDPALHLTRADLTFFYRDGVLHARLRMRPLKKERMKRRKGVEIELRANPGALLDPVTELWQMVAADPVEAAAAATVPLFRRADGQALTTDDVRAMVKALMAHVGENPDDFGAHSLRIGGATGALTAAVDGAVIKVLGRWDSDVYEVYTRLTRQAAVLAASAIGSTPFDDTHASILTEEFDEIALPGAAAAAEAALSAPGGELSDEDEM